MQKIIFIFENDFFWCVWYVKNFRQIIKSYFRYKKITFLFNNFFLGKVQKNDPEKSSFNFTDQISSCDAEQISSWIKEENKIENHMIAKSAENILLDAKQHGCIALKVQGVLKGYMGLYKYGKVYEAGSLLVESESRGLGYGGLLQAKLLSHYKQRALFLITNVSSVKYMSLKNGLIPIEIDMISKSILSAIESGGKLLSDDSVYMNKTLLSNQKFYNLHT